MPGSPSITSQNPCLRTLSADTSAFHPLPTLEDLSSFGLTVHSLPTYADRMLFPPPSDPQLDRKPLSATELGVHKPWQQIAATVGVATIVAWVSAVWMRGLPIAYFWLGTSIGIAALSNRGVARLLFTLCLAMIFLAAVIANEAAAHTLFGVCLYD